MSNHQEWIDKTDAIVVALIDAFSGDSDPGFNDVADLLNMVALKPMSDSDRQGFPCASDNARMGCLDGSPGMAGLIIISDKDGLEVSHVQENGHQVIRAFTLESLRIIG